MNTRFLADLYWALNSENLLQQPPPGLSGLLVSHHSSQALWHSLQRQAEPPLPARRLGLYFEQLIAYALSQQADYALLAHNLGVFEHGQQRGALDLVFEHQQQLHHWELAVKFYLYHAADQHWYGPNAQDQLAIKLQHLFNHQLLLAQHPQLQSRFARPIHSAALVRGYLFYHWLAPEPALPDWLNPQHARGWWCYLDELAERLAAAPASHRWQILPRAHWLGPAQHLSDDLVCDSSAIIQQMTQQFAPPLIVELQFDGLAWQERSRGFVVPKTWPQRADLVSVA